MFILTGRVALVTGGGQNSGEGIAKALALRGAAVIVNGRRVEPIERVAAEIVAAGGRAVASSFDVTDFDAVQERILAAETVLGRHVDIGRLGHPAEVGAVCVYLASEEAGGMTGQTIDFNGGSQMR